MDVLLLSRANSKLLLYHPPFLLWKPVLSKQHGQHTKRMRVFQEKCVETNVVIRKSG